MWDPSCICNLHHSSRQHWILNPLSDARDRACILVDTNQVLNTLSQNGNSPCSFFFFSFLFFIFGLFRASLVANGGSQARVRIGAIATGLYTATAVPDLSCFCDLHCGSPQRQILNPLSNARDQTCILIDASQIRFC